jgi:SAM-dependent methyltransferase
MCDGNNIQFGIENLGEKEIRGKRVLEVGSCDVNGSLRHEAVKHGPSEYVGVDIIAGPGVDIVCSSDDILTRFGKESFDVVISTCALEHIALAKFAISNIKNVCKPGGLVLIIVPSVWPEHNFPFDYWRYSKAEVEYMFSDFDILKIEEKPTFHGPKIGDLVYLLARKPLEFKEKDISELKLYHVPSKGFAK